MDEGNVTKSQGNWEQVDLGQNQHCLVKCYLAPCISLLHTSYKMKHNAFTIAASGHVIAGDSDGFHFHVHRCSLLSLETQQHCCCSLSRLGVGISLAVSVLTDSNSSVVYFTQLLYIYIYIKNKADDRINTMYNSMEQWQRVSKSSQHSPAYCLWNSLEWRLFANSGKTTFEGQ